MRLPLRDAVEKRPPPDEAIDINEANDLVGLNYQVPSSAGYYDQKTHGLPFYQFPHQKPFNNVYYLPQPQQTFYTPLQYFQNIVQDYRQASPYRVDNSLQQLLVSPFGRFGRNLKDGGKEEEKKCKINSLFI